MNHNQSSPTGYPQHPGGTPPAGQPATKASRPWFKKKRFVIPGGLLALFIVIGVASGGGDQEPVTAQPAQSSVTPTATESADVGPADATQDSKADAERAAEDSAAAEASKEAEASEEARAAEEAAAEEAARGTPGQQNALRSAENYLSFTSFSRQGLIDQLVFEGFTAEQAQFGVSQTGL